MNPPLGPRLPRRESGWVKLPEPYTGFEFRFWINAPQRLWLAVSSGDDIAGKEALSKIVLEHNGWCEEDGTPFPPANNWTCWDAIPTELLAAVMVLCNTEMSALAKSLAPKNRR